MFPVTGSHGSFSWLGKSPQAPSHWPAGTNFKLLHGDRLGSKVFRTVVKGGEGASWWPYRSKTKFFSAPQFSPLMVTFRTSNDRIFRPSMGLN